MIFAESAHFAAIRLVVDSIPLASSIATGGFAEIPLPS
jgi:hypothetical protein